MRSPLTDSEKAKVFTLVERYGNQWTKIGQEIGRSKDTIKSFYYRFEESQTFSGKVGRPPTLNNDLQNSIAGYMLADPNQTLRDVAPEFSIPISTVRDILHHQKINYCNKTPIAPLTESHKADRVQFSSLVCAISYMNLFPIIFTDESEIEVQVDSHGVWKVIGTHPAQSYFEKQPHPMSVMIWGGIGPRGFRTSLLRFEGRVNGEYYARSLTTNGIFDQCTQIFGTNWVWQEDNAPVHASKVAQQILLPQIPNKMWWPAKSPDLSPIEQVWGYLKNRLAGQKFKDEESLFAALQHEWKSIPDDILHNFHSSFWARCYVCKQLNGDSLNGHWKMVTQIHNQYRTRLEYRHDQITGQKLVFETK